MFSLKWTSLGSVVVAAGLMGAISSEAADKLSQAEKKWLEEEVSALITQSEAELFQEIASRDRKLFQEIFWARRDYNPTTPDNEFKKEYEARIATADSDRRLSARGRKGSTTDMGKIFLLLGWPSRVDRAGDGSGGDEGPGSIAGSSTPIDDLTLGGDEPSVGGVDFGSAGGSQTMTWVYDPNPSLGIADGLSIQFRSQGGFGFRLVGSDEVERSLERVRQRYITNPAVNYVRDEKGRLKEPQGPADPNSPAKMALQQLKESQTPTSDVAFESDMGFFRSDEGAVYIPILFKVEPGSLRWAGDRAEVTVFGMAENNLGQTVYQFEQTAKFASTSGEPAAYELPILLRPGRYTLYLGVRDDRSELAGTQIVPLEVPDYPDNELKLSSVIMFSKGEKTGESMGEPGKAFLLGGYHWHPRVETTYTTTDELSGVFNAYGYGLDAEGEARLTAQYIFFHNGQRRGQTSEEPFMLAGKDMAITVFQIPLSNFAPGSYRMQIKVTDHVKSKVVTDQITFELDEP